jgi:hypothetical protein
MSTIDDIRARWAAATRGPWAWRGNKDSKTIDLLSARSAWGDVVLDFQRWGLQGARPCFNTDGLIVRPDWIMGPPHHPWEIVGIDHPDAIAIAAAPADVAALLAEVDRLRAALLALVALPPLRYHEMRCYCHHCGAQLPDGNGGHEADCAWVLACDLVAGEAVRP